MFEVEDGEDKWRRKKREIRVNGEIGLWRHEGCMESGSLMEDEKEK